MIAYNNEWLENLGVIESAEEAQKQKLIEKDELDLIRTKFKTGLYTPNTFIRIGLFLLTNVICLFSFGLISMFMMSSSENGFAALAIFFGLVSYASLEFLVHTRHHYRSGADDALLWIAASFLFGGLSVLTRANELQNCILIFIIAAAATTRFTDRVMTAVSYLAFFAILYFLFTGYGPIFKTLLPFIFIGTALIMYFLAKRIQQNAKTLLYKPNIQVIKILSLVSIYVAGNYFVVRELSIELFQLNLPAGAPLPFGWIFWTITCFLPFLYLAVGIRQKDRILIRVGVLIVALTLLTLKFYFYIASAEVLMTLLGIFLLAGSYALQRFLATPRRGFVYSDIEEEESVQVESLVLAETFSPVPAQPEPTRFGGGGFGGAGSSADF